MTTHDILIELLALQLWQQEAGGLHQSWNAMLDEDRQLYRDAVLKANRPSDIYLKLDGMIE